MRQLWKWVRQTRFAEGVIALFTGVLTVASIFQFVILRGQLDVMQKDQRAWVAAVTGTPETPESGAGKLLRVPVEITNTGKSAARDVKVDVIARIVKNGEQPNCEYGKQVPGIHRSTKVFVPTPNSPHLMYAQILSATDTEKAVAQPKVISADEIQQLTDGREFFVVYGRVSYKDIFNHQHWVHFCSWGTLSAKPVMLTSGNCAGYNEVDDD
jgi:hypothetical protein